MDNIVLIGMPASGKSTLGVILAKILGKDFWDTDLMIQKSQGRLLQDIINRQGLEEFIKIEEETLLKLDLKDSIISTGGSAVYSDKAMQHLKCTGTIVYLHVSYEEIVRRLKNIATRGIVIKKGSSLGELYEERVPLYLKYADVTIDCTGKDVEQCLADILSALEGEK